MNKYKIEKLKKVLSGKDLSAEEKLILLKKGVLNANENIGSLKEMEQELRVEIEKKIGKEATSKLDSIIDRMENDTSAEDIQKSLKENLQENKQEIKELVKTLDKEFPNEFKIKNIDVILKKIDLLKEKPKWYKQFDILDFFGKLRHLLEYLSKKTYKTTIENKSPVKVIYVDEKGKPKEIVSKVQMPLGSGGGSSETKLLDKDGNLIDSSNPLPVLGDIEITQEKESSANSNTKVSVGNTSTTVIASNSNRRFALIVNDSDEDIYLNLSGTAVINEGIRINASGGNYYENIYTGIITGICASGSKNVTVVEV